MRRKDKAETVTWAVLIRALKSAEVAEKDLAERIKEDKSKCTAILKCVTTLTGV